MTESLDETEMKMYLQEVSGGGQNAPLSSQLMTMPASCNSLLKVSAYDVMGHLVNSDMLNQYNLRIYPFKPGNHVKQECLSFFNHKAHKVETNL